MSTYLQLCKDLRREIRIPGSGPDAVTGQDGEMEDIVEWIKNGWIEIQLLNGGQWRWLKRNFTFNTVDGTRIYATGDVTDVDAAAAIDRFINWHLNDRVEPPKVYLTSGGVAGQTYLNTIPWTTFDQIYGIGTQNTGYPVHVAVDEQNQLHIGPTPNGIYTITGKFWRGPQILAVDGDIPECPTQYHQLLVYWAMEHYAFNDVAEELLARSVKFGSRMRRQLESNQLFRGQWRNAGPLA